jgi:hypothetical protein
MAILPLPPDSLPDRVIARMVIINGTQCAFLAAQPNWETAITVALEMPTDVEKEAITFYESRRNFSQTARYKLTYTCYLSNSADATELRLFLTRVRAEPVVVPLWPDTCETARDQAVASTQILLIDLPVRYGSTWVIANDDFSQFDFVNVAGLNESGNMIARINPGLPRAYPKGSKMYPLLFGKFDDRPKPEAITDETLETQFVIKESSAFAMRLSPAVIPLEIVGPNVPAFATTRKWVMAPNFSKPMDWTEKPDITYEQVGFLREEQQRVYDHRNARGQELEFYENDRSRVAKIEYFWRERRATTLRFFMPTYRGDLRMLYDTPVPGNPRWIRCERNFFSNPGREAQPGDGFICLVSSTDSVDPYAIRTSPPGVIDVPPSETRIIVAANAVPAHGKDKTIVCHFVLCRFADATLDWTYTTPYLATTRIKFRELPHEYANTPDPLPEPAYLFIFTEAGIRTDRFTSYETNVRIPSGIFAGNYVSAPFSFDVVKLGLKLDQEKMEFKSFPFSGNPLNKMWPFALDGILTVEILEVDVNNLTAAPLSRFYGDVWDIDSAYKVTAIPFGSLFDRKFPRFLLSVPDNYVQFSPPTMLAASAFAMSGHIDGSVDNLSQTLLITSANAHAKPVDYFAGGWLETGTGVTLEKRGILHSTPAGSADVQLTIDRPLLKAGSNQVLTIYPGYDGSIDQCDTKFNNRINFGGQPFIPDVNPAVKAMKQATGAGGKKG